MTTQIDMTISKVIDWLVDQLYFGLLRKNLLKKIYKKVTLISNYVLIATNKKDTTINNYVLTKASKENITIKKAILS